MAQTVRRSPGLERLPEEVRKGLEFLLVRNMDEVLEGALLSLPAGRGDPPRSDYLDGTREPGIQLSQ